MSVYHEKCERYTKTKFYVTWIILNIFPKKKNHKYNSNTVVHWLHITGKWNGMCVVERIHFI